MDFGFLEIKYPEVFFKQQIKFQMKINKFLSTLAIFIALFSTTCFSQTLQDTLALIDKAMSIYLPQNPGSQLSIQRNGKIIFSKAYGMADLEHNVPLTLTSKIEAGSVSKQFTAAAILLLEQQGKLSLNDDVRKYIPELPNYGNIIKLEQMMHHTSGLRDWGSVAYLSGWERTTKTYTNDDALEIIKAQKAFNNVPGAEYIYSNSNYNLLAIVVQRVSGQSLAEFTKQNIFIPAGMTNTEWRDNHNRIVKDRAMSYVLIKNGYETLMPNEDAYGNGGLITTTEDLLKWNDFYLSGKLGTPSLLSKQIKVEAFNNGKMNDYGAGLFIQKFKGQNLIQHGGATAGYRAFLETFPDLNLSFSFLSNTSQFDNSKVRLENVLRNIFITEPAKTPLKKDEIKYTATKTLLLNYVGWYSDDRDGRAVKVEVKNDSMFFDNRLLMPQSETKFKMMVPSSIFVEISDSGKKLNVITERDSISYSKEESPTVDNQYLEKYIGKFFSTETNSTITVYLKEGKLMINLKPNSDYELKPTYKDGFNGLGGNLYFIKNKRNKIVAMKASNARVRNIEFKKLN
jgi:CubicO group peptidase (beta-lactamase class C family)